ncbi:methionyl-tRNA formyltransferase [Geothrix sp. PMB-07]|uniref:methionyl-tRNA formyltransferase n=1 Tax=Geothrix sp. PMB-07 TaxID=3068640 RepID=UPI0027421458|nr:formyltransferase family protein [Geothrix sp. PMB-07]WLT31792.1 formyltransferase family protein [Geothrix sp. PMB-07]
MRFGVWTSGRGPAAAVVAAIRRAGVELGHVLCTDNACLAGLRTAAGVVPCCAGDTAPALLLTRAPVDCVLLLSYPELIEPELLDRQLFLNCHNSLLPAYRGLHAFTWALIHGESQVGYTLHRAGRVPDAGPILCQRAFQVGLDETINDVFQKADALLPAWIPESLAQFGRGELSFTPQDESKATRFRKRTLADGRIDWNRSALAIHNFIRSQAPPYTRGAFTLLQGIPVFIGPSEWTPEPPSEIQPGSLLACLNGNGLLVQCADRPLRVRAAWTLGADGECCEFRGQPGYVFEGATG